MRLIDVSHAEPALNLALDEALLEAAAKGETGDTLRLWESPTPFVVLGTGQLSAQEANLAACEADGVPVLRRCSAGGCVLQGVGSLNYAVVLRLEHHPRARSLHESYCYLLNLLRDRLRLEGCALTHAGTSDLALEGRKVSGNAQRRKRDVILHHGTLLYAPNYEGMARYLHEPADRPAYREGRRHEEFVTAVPFGKAALQRLITEAYSAVPGVLSAFENALAEQLAEQKYRQAVWNLRR